MTLKEQYMNGISEKCFTCSRFEMCISEYTKLFIGERDNYMDKVEVIPTYYEWEVRYDGNLVLAIDDGSCEIGGKINECDSLCEAICVAAEYIIANISNMKQDLDNYQDDNDLNFHEMPPALVSAIVAKLAQAWYRQYSDNPDAEE